VATLALGSSGLDLHCRTRATCFVWLCHHPHH